MEELQQLIADKIGGSNIYVRGGEILERVDREASNDV